MMPLATSLFLELDENELEVAEQMHRRQISDEQLRKFEGYVGEMFTAFGLDLDTPATRDTPRRFVRALLDVTEGYDGDPKLLKVFPTECRGEPDCRLSQVIEGPIHFFSLCEHHALPFFSQAYVGYIAHERIIGISKLTRLVRVCLPSGSRSRNASGSRSPTRWWPCCSRTEWPCTSRPIIYALRCETSARSRP